MNGLKVAKLGINYEQAHLYTKWKFNWIETKNKCQQKNIRSIDGNNNKLDTYYWHIEQYSVFTTILSVTVSRNRKQKQLNYPHLISLPNWNEKQTSCWSIYMSAHELTTCLWFFNCLTIRLFNTIPTFGFIFVSDSR